MRQFPTYSFLICLLLALLAASCAAPRTFIQTTEPGWHTIELREDVTFDQAWRSIVDLLSKRFDIEIVSKDDGYVRTGWLYTWTGELDEYYKVRAIVKFSPDKKIVEVKSEAQHYHRGFLGIGSGWELGTDRLLTTTVRTDIMGKVGRVTR